MKRNPRVDDFLFDYDYKVIIKKVVTFCNSKRLVEQLENIYANLKTENPKFWVYLYAALEEYGTKENLNYDEFTTSDFECKEESKLLTLQDQYGFLVNYVSKRIEEELSKKSLQNQIFTIAYLPTLINSFQEVNQITGKRAKYFGSRRKIISEWIIKLAHKGHFNTYDLEAVPAAEKQKTLETLLDYNLTTKEVYDEDASVALPLLTSITDDRTGEMYYIIDTSTIHGRSLESAFYKNFMFYKEYVGASKSGFSQFLLFERKRMRHIQQYFQAIGVQHTILNSYLARLAKLTESSLYKSLEIGPFSFDIPRVNWYEKLVALMIELTDAVQFIYTDSRGRGSKEDSVKRAVDILTSENYKKESSDIRFGCETTIVAYILNWINIEFSTSQKLHSYNIGKSKKFYVPTLKKPSYSTAQMEFTFRVLTRDNHAQSVGRYREYRKIGEREERITSECIEQILHKYRRTVTK